MHSKTDNREIIVGKETDKAIKELFESLLSKYQIGLEESMKGSKFVFNCVDLIFNILQM